jgi:hypothetical protein
MSDYSKTANENQLINGVLSGISEVRGNADLTSIKQSFKRYAVMYNFRTMQTFVVDTVKARYDRMRRRICAWADVVNGSGMGGEMVMVGLTYRPGKCYSPNDIRSFMLAMRKKLGDKLWAYAWVSELQERGALHYHVLLYVAPGTRVPYPDKSRMWLLGSSKVDRNVKSVYYIVSYTKKGGQKDYSLFPEGARSHAVWIHDSILNKKVRYLNLKGWERAIVDADGWEELRVWRKIYVGMGSEWRYDGSYGGIEEAEYRTSYWLDLFSKHPI